MDKVKQCYALIEFPDKSTDVVPENWLFEQKCYWPNYNQTKLKAAVKRKEPVQDGWKLFEPARLLKKCGKNGMQIIQFLLYPCSDTIHALLKIFIYIPYLLSIFYYLYIYY